MKTIEQLLELTKNPYYELSLDERRVLDDFLEKQRAIDLTRSQSTSSTKSSKTTPVTVRNIVAKVDTYPPEAS